MNTTVPALGVAALAFLGASCAQEASVALPSGETPLSDIGIYRVAYQSYEGDVVLMPPSWMGHFETVSGITYAPQERVLDRPAILLHCPWRVPAGKVWVDYPLRLPDVKPITLSFGIAMRPDIAVPGKSDGVTFSAFLAQGNREQELFREHWTQGEWQDYEFDLSAYAGQDLTVRLQTEPGPSNSAGFDFSYFGAAKIAAGTAAESRAELLRRLTSTQALKAHEKADLRRLSNDPRRGIVPGNLLDCDNRIRKDGEAWVLEYESADGTVRYRYTPKAGTLDDFSVQVDDADPFRPAAGGGVTFAVPAGGQEKLVAARNGRLVSLEESAEPRALRAVWAYQAEGVRAEVAWTFGIQGKALTVTAQCEQPVLAGLSLGHVAQAPLRRTFGVPYLAGSVAYLPAENAFVCCYLDWTQSNASSCPQGEATYEPRTDGTRNPLYEVGYVAVSPNVAEVLPNLPHPPSPYLEVLGPCIMLDIWGHHGGTYEGDAENLRALKDSGVDHMAIIQHVWQCHGYDVKLPDHLPAHAAFGGDEGMAEFGRAAKECGYLWSLHENYIDLYPDAPSYDPTARVLRQDGTPSPAWFNAGTGVQSFGLKCNRALGYARQNSPEAHRRFGTTAAYLDVHTCVPPWHQLDRDASQPLAAMARAKVQYDTELFQFERDTHEGPLFGEGYNHFYWAGRCDGVEAQVAGGEDHVPFLEFDLLKLHPQMVNHGMGYYERWFREGYNAQYGVTTGTPRDVDKYRAQEMAYGHAGFVGHLSTDNLQWVAKEHNLMAPVQRLYGTAKPTEISYEIDGRFVPASVALVMGERWRQRIVYDSGLTVWVNWAREPWTVEGRVLPQWGFLALGPATQVQTCLQDGRTADYVECPDFVFADARTYFHLPYLQGVKDIEPKLADFQYLGEGKIRVTYEWMVKDTLAEDYHCFVHFTNPGQEQGDHIVFQQDHAVPKATSQWRPGDVVTDGPYEIQVPTGPFDTYDLVIGLHKGGRVPLKGLEAGGLRILLARLMLNREGDRIADITLGDLTADREKAAASRRDFTEGLNPPGTWVDFGAIATNGSAKVNRGGNSLTVFPYPRDREFRVALDLGKLVVGAAPAPAKATVHAMAAGTQADLGEVPARVDKGRLVFEVGTPGASRYVVSW